MSILLQLYNITRLEHKAATTKIDRLIAEMGKEARLDIEFLERVKVRIQKVD